MYIKTRGQRKLLYRSKWVRKGAADNTHGYAKPYKVWSLPADTLELPAELSAILTMEERVFVDANVCAPARLEVETVRKNEVDPIWRLEEAERLALEAARCSERGVVPDGKVAAVQSALLKVKTMSAFKSQLPPADEATSASQAKTDPMREALKAIQTARDAVLAGRYGNAPLEGVRSTQTYKLWSEIFDVVGGADGNSLMRALQTRGFAKTRGK
jgi:hypothetical protein